MPDRHAAGEKIRRRVLGDAHVDAALARSGDFDSAFQSLIPESAWGSVWARETISLRERSMLTLALLAANGNFEEFAMHLRATANTGASVDDVMEVILHVAVYAGLPRANHAIRIARETYAEMGVDL